MGFPEVSAAAKSKAEAELEDVLGDDSTCINEIKELYQEVWTWLPHTQPRCVRRVERDEREEGIWHNTSGNA